MSFHAETIANAFIDQAWMEQRDLNRFQLQRLLYLAQGHALSLFDQPLIKDHCQCRHSGPIFPAVHKKLKGYSRVSLEQSV